MLTDKYGNEPMAYSGYANSNYNDIEVKGILLANWNVYSDEDKAALEEQGYALEWEDEWASCDTCGLLVRTSPDSYSYQPEYVVMDCELYCNECLSKNRILVDDYLESLENDPKVALNNPIIQPMDYGYLPTNPNGSPYKNGLYEGMNDKPIEIFESLQPYHDRILFVIKETSQFYITFEAYYYPTPDTDTDTK